MQDSVASYAKALPRFFSAIYHKFPNVLLNFLRQPFQPACRRILFIITMPIPVYMPSTTARIYAEDRHEVVSQPVTSWQTWLQNYSELNFEIKLFKKKTVYTVHNLTLYLPKSNRQIEPLPETLTPFFYYFLLLFWPV